MPTIRLDSRVVDSNYSNPFPFVVPHGTAFDIAACVGHFNVDLAAQSQPMLDVADVPQAEIDDEATKCAALQPGQAQAIIWGWEGELKSPETPPAA